MGFSGFPEISTVLLMHKRENLGESRRTPLEARKWLLASESRRETADHTRCWSGKDQRTGLVD